VRQTLTVQPAPPPQLLRLINLHALPDQRVFVPPKLPLQFMVRTMFGLPSERM